MGDFDNIRSKTNSKEYEENYDRIFKKDKCCERSKDECPCSNYDKDSSVLDHAKETK